MSIKIIVGLVIVAALGAGGWWYINNSGSSTTAVAAAPAPLVTSDNVPPAATPTPGTPNTVTIPASGSSDTALTQESAGLDAQVNGLNSDTGKADTSMTAQ